MFASAASLLLVGYLPGALLYRLPAWHRERRAALAAEERVFWAVLISTTWSVMVVLGLSGLGKYSFEWLLWIDGGLALAFVALGRGRLRYRGEAPRVSTTAIVPVALAVVGAWQLLPPAEYAMGGKDPGVYINEGIQIAQRGTLFYRDPVVASVPEPFRDLFFPKAPVDEYYAPRFMGYFILDPGTGSVVGQFPHGYPASIAIGYGLAGLSGARQTVVFWSVLGVIGIYLTAVRVFGRLAAAAGAALLLVNVVEVWWGRYPNVEVASRALLFGSLLAFCRAADGDRPFFGAVAGALAGLPLFFRYDAILTIGAAVAAAVLVVANRQRVGWAFAITLAASTASGFWYLLGPMWTYSSYYFGFTLNEGGWLLAGAAGAGLVARLALTRDRWAAPVLVSLPVLLAVAFVTLAAYAYLLREPGGRLSVHDAMAFRTLAWYVTPIGLLAAVIGLAMSVRRLFWVAPIVFTTIAVHAVFFFYKTRIVPQHFWASRRFLTVILPTAALAIAALAVWLLDPGLWQRWLARLRRTGAVEGGRSSGRSFLHAALVTAAICPLGLVFWRASTPVRHHVEYAGLIPRLESIAAAIGDRDLVLVESRGTGSDLHVLALPLAYIYDRQVLVIHSGNPDKSALADFVRWAASRYDRVLFMGGSGTDLLSRTLGAQPVGGDRFTVPEYASPTNAYPTEVRLKEFNFGLYHLRAGTSAQSGPLDLAIGTVDALHVHNFFTPERHDPDGVMFRWTGASSEVSLIGLDAAATEVVIWMSHGGRPSAAPSPDVTVSLGGVTLGSVVPDDEVRPYRFAVPRTLAARLAASDDAAELRLDVSTWSPQQLLGTPDPRELGVMVTRVQVQ